MKHARDDYNRIQDPAGKIPADEPVFLLRAQDQLACKAVAFYASLCEENQAPAVAAKARAHADAMAAWPVKKVPDLTAPTSAAGATKPNELTSSPEPAPALRAAEWVELPPLPTPTTYARFGEGSIAAYTAEQMRDYALEAIRASGLLPVAREGLSVDRLRSIAHATGMINDAYEDSPGEHCVRFARAIEAAHGIAPASGDAPGEAK